MGDIIEEIAVWTLLKENEVAEFPDTNGYRERQSFEDERDEEYRGFQRSERYPRSPSSDEKDDGCPVSSRSRDARHPEQTQCTRVQILTTHYVNNLVVHLIRWLTLSVATARSPAIGFQVLGISLTVATVLMISGML